MIKYELRFRETNNLCGTFNNEKEAQEALLERIKGVNSCRGESCQVSVFDYYLKKIQTSLNYEEAREYLCVTKNRDLTVSKEPSSRSSINLKDVATLVYELNPSHIKALIAWNKLYTIAQAWNKIDGFVPDWSDNNQYKYYPWFFYDTKDAGFVYATTYYAPSHSNPAIGSRLCFASRERAKEFGNMFIELFNEVLLLNN